MAHIFQVHIATTLSGIINAPVADVLPLVSRAKPSTKHADNFALAVIKLLPLCKNDALSNLPRDEFALTVAEQYIPDEYITAATAEGGYINLEVSPAKFISTVIKETRTARLSLPREAQEYTQKRASTGKKVCVEYEFPNIGKQFEGRHWRSVVVASFVARACEALGYMVTTRCKIKMWSNDTAALLLGYAVNGSKEQLARSPLEHLHALYKEAAESCVIDPDMRSRANQLLRDLYRGEPSVTGQWKKLWEAWSTALQPSLLRIGSCLALETDEIIYTSVPSVEMVLCSLQCTSRDGFNSEERVMRLDDWKLGTAVLISDGLPTQMMVDVAMAVGRSTSGITTTYSVLPHGKGYALKQLGKLLKLIDRPMELVETSFGKLHGMNLSTNLSPESLLQTAKEHMEVIIKQKEELEVLPSETADLIGITAILVQIHQSRRTKDLTFDWSRVISNQGDIGVYIQYTHARLASILIHTTPSPNADLKLLSSPLLLKLALLISKYPSILHTSITTLDASLLVTYLVALCHEVSSCLSVLRVKGKPKEVREARGELINAAKMVIEWGLEWLGVRGVDRM